jgi:hypothetical protein
MDMRRLRRAVLIVVAAGLALPLAACSGGDPAAGPAAGPGGATTAPGVGGLGPATGSTATAPVPPPTRGPRTGPPIRPPSLEGEVVSLNRSGGLAGLAQTVAVLPDGSWTFSEIRRDKIERTGQLTAAQRRQLNDLLARPALAKEAKIARRQPAKCSDDYLYTLTTGGRTVRWSDCDGQAGRPKTAAAIADLLELWTPLSGGI